MFMTSGILVKERLWQHHGMCYSTGVIRMICTQYIMHWTLLQLSYTWYTPLLIKAAVCSTSCKLIKWTLILHICKKEKKKASSKFWSLFNSEWEKYKFQIQLNFPSDFVYLLHMNNTMTRQMVTIWVTKPTHFKIILYRLLYIWNYNLKFQNNITVTEICQWFLFENSFIYNVNNGRTGSPSAILVHQEKFQYMNHSTTSALFTWARWALSDYKYFFHYLCKTKSLP